MPQNGHSTANTAVPRWQRDLKNALSACYPPTNQQVRVVPNHVELWHPRCISPEREAFAMSEMRSLNEVSELRPPFAGKHADSFLQFAACKPRQIKAARPLVQRLMRLIEG